MKFISWNVNGLRAILKKDFIEEFNSLNADFVCLQETKMQEGQATMDLPGYYQYFNYAERKGYSGTAILTRIKPISVHLGMDVEEFDNEGRLIRLEYPDFFLICCYTPNSGSELKRLAYRMKWEDAFRNYVNKLKQQKTVIICGDLNVAHEEIDLKNFKTNHHNAGFTDEERSKMTELLDSGFTDSFRSIYPDVRKYSWWSYRGHARENNAGWRIDYFLVSNNEERKLKIKDAQILNDYLGSDHCPVVLITE
ncbi:exodeoxyribonuclease III [Xylocopilactobacillus apicola]|uniref:Exodeoxyribonuclease III n=1 Tax=Xylocopilactobacillus apicola TaxID=2932184 RepID=A0AAU9D2N5_9LACO|nr:exodeoxyribonuclease III [Xylocopilactobacillus apicola]BDR59061.1 exodeoxyribonuclease III [Xylocopilactobacillus apicola]